MPSASTFGLTQLVDSYFRFCDWIDLREDFAFQAVRELQAGQALFGTDYVIFPDEFFADDRQLRGLLAEREALLQIVISGDLDNMESALEALKPTTCRLTTGHLNTWAHVLLGDPTLAPSPVFLFLDEEDAVTEAHRQVGKMGPTGTHSS